MLEKAGKNSGDNRRDNRGLVLRMVATGACRTRRDLVVRTGLSKMTISNIVGEMIDGDVHGRRCRFRDESFYQQG